MGGNRGFKSLTNQLLRCIKQITPGLLRIYGAFVPSNCFERLHALAVSDSNERGIFIKQILHACMPEARSQAPKTLYSGHQA